MRLIIKDLFCLSDNVYDRVLGINLKIVPVMLILIRFEYRSYRSLGNHRLHQLVVTGIKSFNFVLLDPRSRFQVSIALNYFL